MTWTVKDVQPIGTALIIVIAMTAVMLSVRFHIVEPEAIAVACAAQDSGWRCALRDAAVFGFLHNVYGWTSLLAGAFATVTRWRWLALIAMLAGCAGAVLFTFELSGAGLLLGALVWTERAQVTDNKRRDEEQA
jgi:hypothetical protein